MIDNISIKKYRNLNTLDVKNFSRINLFIGKNNVGKSNFLESILLLLSKFNFDILTQLLSDRDEITSRIARNEGYDLQSLSSIFYNRDIDFRTSGSIVLNSSINGVEETLTIRLVRYTIKEEEIDAEDGGKLFAQNKVILADSEIDSIQDYNIGLEIKSKEFTRLLEFSDDKFFYRRYRYINPEIKNVQLIRTKNFDRAINQQLFDSITLTDKEELVIRGLKIIAPTIQRINFIETEKSLSSSTRVPMVKVEQSDKITPLKSMGDGINRLLTIILALVNCQNGYLLIDEFENGLHYSVQEKLWEIIFEISELLNVQLFVTTHSNDCINALSSILSKKDIAKVFRLENIENVTTCREISKEILFTAVNNNIEIR